MSFFILHLRICACSPNGKAFIVEITFNSDVFGFALPRHKSEIALAASSAPPNHLLTRFGILAQESFVAWGIERWL